MEHTPDTLLAEARALLSQPVLDAAAYSRLERYVLAHQSRLAADPAFGRLRDTLHEAALRFGLPTLEQQQEHFGLDSCAQ